MSLQEGFPSNSQEPAVNESVFFPDGTVNEDFLKEQYGLGIEEANQIVSFGKYTGTMAQMLGDEKCPVGEMVSSAYKEKGLDGVEETFKNLRALDSNFNPVISEAARELQKKN